MDKTNIGKNCKVNILGDLAMNKGLFGEIRDKQLTVIKVTKGGLVYIKSEDEKFYSIPPKNIDIL